MIKFTEILNEYAYKAKNKKEIPNGPFCWDENNVCDFFDDGKCELNFKGLRKTRDGILKSKECRKRYPD